MASSLTKYKFSGPTTARPSASTAQSANVSKDPDSPPSCNTADASTEHGGLDMADLKLHIPHSVKWDITAMIREELKNALAEDFNFIKTELQAIRNEIATYIHNIAQMKWSTCKLW